jgi:hypothetical protein
MPKATVNGKVCDVRAVRDLENSWAIAIYSGEKDTVPVIPRDVARIVVKVHAKSRWTALDTGLRALKDQGKIDSYELEPRPADDVPKKKAGAAAAEETEEEGE